MDEILSGVNGVEADVLVIGGGINGTGIARDAAGRGYDVVLCEQDDLAQAISSASSKLIHTDSWRAAVSGTVSVPPGPRGAARAGGPAAGGAAHH